MALNVSNEPRWNKGVADSAGSLSVLLQLRFASYNGPDGILDDLFSKLPSAMSAVRPRKTLPRAVSHEPVLRRLPVSV